MNLDQSLHLAQIIVTGTILSISAYYVWRQLNASHRLHRRDLYATTTQVPDDYYNTCLMHWRDHFAEETYRRVYRGNSARCRSYLLMKRKYMYLVFQWFVRDEFGQAAYRWLEELVKWREFEDVHNFHRHYYKKYSRVVDRLMEPGTKPWFCEECEFSEPSSPTPPN